jgi:transposase
MTDPTSPVTGGVDTHKDTHVAAVLNPLGVVLGTSDFHRSRC